MMVARRWWYSVSFVVLSMCVITVTWWYYVLDSHTEASTLSDVRLMRYRFDLLGMERSYMVVSPPAEQQITAIVLVFHPSQSSAVAMRQMVGEFLEPRAARDGVLLVYLQGFEGHFNDCRRQLDVAARHAQIDDVAYIDSVLQQLSMRVDGEAKSRFHSVPIHGWGYSNGAQMALRYAVEGHVHLSGLLMVAANVPAAENWNCIDAPVHANKVAIIVGTDDRINPYLGGEVQLFAGQSRGAVLSARESQMWFFAGQEGVQNQIGGTWLSNGLVARECRLRNAYKSVRLFSIEGGGHTIPQSAYRAPRILGTTFQNDIVLEQVWDDIHTPVTH